MKIAGRKKKIVIAALVLILAGAVGIYFYTRPREVTNYAEFEEDQEKPDSQQADSGVTDGIQIPGYKLCGGSTSR